MSKSTIVLTGFGTFDGYEENPSELAVSKIALQGLDVKAIRLVTEILPVEYDFVTKRIAELWETHSPNLMVHCGVHPKAKGAVLLEKNAFNFGYCRKDIKGAVPTDNCCFATSPKVSSTSLDLDKVVADADSSVLPLKVSNDPGRYLCSYSYFLSLHSDATKSLFIHVPTLCKEVTVDDIANTVKFILLQCIAQLSTE